MGRTVNPLRKLRRFESFSPHSDMSLNMLIQPVTSGTGSPNVGNSERLADKIKAEVAHLVEHQPSKLRVAGSSPVFRSKGESSITAVYLNG